MSHHLLPPYGGERVINAPVATRRQHHCGYMEELRQSVEQLRRQTARGSPSTCSSTGSDSGRRSASSRSLDTLYQRSLGTHECLVVYEPHNVVIENQESVYERYANSSGSSSGSNSSIGSSPGDKLDDVSNIFEDSGVDLGFPKLQAHIQNPYPMEYTNMQSVQGRQKYGLVPTVHTPYRGQSGCIATCSDAIDNAKHIQASELGGMCFCAVEVHRNQKGGNCNSVHGNVSHNVQKDNMTFNGHLQGACINHKQHVMTSSISSSQNPSIGFFTEQLPLSRVPLFGKPTNVIDSTYVDMSMDTRPAVKRHAFVRNNLRHHSQYGANSCDDSDDFETPTTTPTPDNGDMYVKHNPTVYKGHSQMTCSTNGRQVTHAEAYIERKSKGVEAKPQDLDDPGYVQPDRLHRPTEFLYRKSDHGKNQNKYCTASIAPDCVARNGIPLPGIHRSPSVTSLISMTDTMSVTSLEVANLMAVSSKEEKKSAVRLEKERLQLQHQRLESYQKYPDDSLSKNSWMESGRKPYSDDSLKKQKIFQSVLEALPASGRSKEVKGESNLHHFVTQSLQSFFETGSCKEPGITEKIVLSSHDKGSDSCDEGLDSHDNGINSHGKVNQNYHDVTRKHRSENGNYMNVSTSPKRADQSVPLPSLFQLTASFRLFHVVYGDWTDLRNLRLYVGDIILEENSRSPIDFSRSPGSTSRSTGSSSRSSGGSPGGRSVLSSDSGAFRSFEKVSPGGKYTFLIISYLGNPRMDMDTGGLQVGDHIIEVNDVCLLNKTPEAFYSTLRKLDQVHLVIGRRRATLSANRMAACDSSML